MQSLKSKLCDVKLENKSIYLYKQNNFKSKSRTLDLNIVKDLNWIFRPLLNANEPSALFFI